MKLTYVSQGGRLSLGGGSHPLMKIKTILGLGLPEREYTNATFARTAGQTELGRRDLPRTITISGNLIGGQKEIENYYKTIYYDGILYLDFGSRRRKIKCKCINPVDVTRYPRTEYNDFVLSFMSDDPYFEDYAERVNYIAAVGNNLKTPFTLPTMFSTKTSSANVNVSGDMSVYPAFEIKAKATGQATQDAGFYLTNATTKTSIGLYHPFKDGEKVVIDIGSRKIISYMIDDNQEEIVTNITNTLSDRYVLSDFKLIQGVNHISYTYLNPGLLLTIKMKHTDKYLTAVY